MKGLQIYTPSNIKMSILILLYASNPLVNEFSNSHYSLLCASIEAIIEATLLNAQSFRLLLIIFGKHV